MPDTAKYDIYYSDESFNNLTEIVPTASSVAGFPDAWIFVSEDPTDASSIQETLKFFRCWWSLTTIPSISPQISSRGGLVRTDLFNRYASGAPRCDISCLHLPGIVRGQEVYVATVAIGEDGSSAEEGSQSLSAITTAESERPPRSRHDSSLHRYWRYRRRSLSHGSSALLPVPKPTREKRLPLHIACNSAIGHTHLLPSWLWHLSLLHRRIC